MRFLNPKTDFAFKKIFGSEQSRDILISFLNAILEFEAQFQIEEVTILDPYTAPKIRGMKDSYVDVRAKDGTGRQFIIEMQVLNMPGFEQRILYNACKTYAGQIEKGEDYRALTDVIALTVTDFVMFPGRSGVISKYKLRAEDGGLYSNDLELVFAELPKFDKPQTALVEVKDKWLYFLQHAPDLDLVPPVLQAEAPISHAFEIANRAGLSAEEEEAQTKREIFIQDQRGVAERLVQLAEEASRAKAEGKAEGLAEGKAEGLAEGKAEAARAIARSLLALMDDAQIAQITNLALDDIAALRKL